MKKANIEVERAFGEVIKAQPGSLNEHVNDFHTTLCYREASKITGFHFIVVAMMF